MDFANLENPLFYPSLARFYRANGDALLIDFAKYKRGKFADDLCYTQTD